MIHPQFDPIAISLGPLAIRWYGLMYLLAFLQFFLLMRYRLQMLEQRGTPLFSIAKLDDLLTYAVVGVVVGGRLGYVLFYKPMHFLHNPLEIFQVWQGGMSFHGGFLGVLLAMVFFARRQGLRFFQLMDVIAPCVPLGLAAGRLGNFINGELWGRSTTGWWGMVFPQAGDQLLRHPSQLYQMTLEGLFLFVVLWWFARKPRPEGRISAVFLGGYGLARFIVEFVREPDTYLGLLPLGMTMGQWLCVPMLIASLVLWWWAARLGPSSTTSSSPASN